MNSNKPTYDSPEPGVARATFPDGSVLSYSSHRWYPDPTTQPAAQKGNYLHIGTFTLTTSETPGTIEMLVSVKDRRPNDLPVGESTMFSIRDGEVVESVPHLLSSLLGPVVRELAERVLENPENSYASDAR